MGAESNRWKGESQLSSARSRMTAYTLLIHPREACGKEREKPWQATRKYALGPTNTSRLVGPSGHIALAPTPTSTSMDAEQRADTAMDTGQSSEFASHEMRITQGGKIRAWVEFALKFLEACKSHSIY